MRNLVFLFISFIVISSCDSNANKVSYAVDPNNRTVEVLEVIQANAYTYLNVAEDNQKFWIAVPTMDAQKGDALHFTQSMEMTDFHSRDLDRTFELVLFVDDVSTLPIPAKTASLSTPAQQHEGRPKTDKKPIEIKHEEGVVPLSDLFANPGKYDQQLIKVTGEVTKFNTGIMGKNWAHIQDGTSFGDYFDLTVTTLDVIPVGDVVVFEGTIALNKDLGSGYFYEFLMEDAKAKRAEMY
ncbi:MAG: SH3-like domain-containing protein [Bacteroidetes bacterium]|nr:SH3-like domain-containing protein [Bacteroidota bacterium]MBU1578251.1 SH3-like domain-containing protein [Bacteroidota bacterium]MBU2558269.1 SH3-like domain-containing protein [Bacteroidota bacterium]